jgi:hypothetical protein
VLHHVGELGAVGVIAHGLGDGGGVAVASVKGA